MVLVLVDVDADVDAGVDVDDPLPLFADRLPNTSVHPSLRTCRDGVLGFLDDMFVKLSAKID